jgi:hypothetical protein
MPDRVSLVVTSDHHAHYLDQWLEALLAQNFVFKEILVDAQFTDGRGAALGFMVGLKK